MQFPICLPKFLVNNLIVVDQVKGLDLLDIHLLLLIFLGVEYASVLINCSNNLSPKDRPDRDLFIAYSTF